MRRSLSTAVLAILAALVWAPLTVSAAPPDPLTATSSPLATPAASIPASLAANGGTVPEPGSSPTPGPAAPTASADPPASMAAAASTPVPAPASGESRAAPASNGPPASSPSTAPGIVDAGAPLPSVVGAPATPASADPATGTGAAERLPAGLSQTMLPTVIGVALVALVGIVFMLLAAGDRRGGARNAGAPGEAMGERTVRRTRIPAADDPILRAMGLGKDARPGADGRRDPDED